jgi:hypothetical protein
MYLSDPCEFDEASDDCVDSRSTGPPRRVWLHDWVEEHYDALCELYGNFRENGMRVFGGAFHQLSNFADFTEFIFNSTVVQPPDLLKQSVAHVRHMGASTRGKHGLHGVSTASVGGAARNGS